MRIKTLKISFFLAVIFIFWGCEGVSKNQPIGLSMENITFRDVPGITDEEIAAIEALQKQYTHFTYGMLPTTEAFLKDNGEVGGFGALFCEWLSRLFGITFQLEFVHSQDPFGTLLRGEVDFSGEIKITEERRQVFIATDPIALRSMKMIRKKGSEPISSIAMTRLPRYGFMRATASIDDVAAVTEPGSYEIVLIDFFGGVYEMFEQGEIDALIVLNPAEAHYDIFGEIIIEDFFPLIFSPVSMVTVKHELSPIISVVQKVLDNGGFQYFNELYRKGYEEYRKYKLFLHLTEEEREYLRNTSVVPLAAGHEFFPVSFFNKYDKKWEGSAFEILNEVEKLTGLNFEVVNDQYLVMEDIGRLLLDGTAHLTPAFIYSADRRDSFLWAKNTWLKDRYALLSKRDFPNVSINEIPNANIGLVKDAGYTAMFKAWFPQALNTQEYPTHIDALNALERGEIDLAMATISALLIVANYYEIQGYKANFIFEPPFDITFGFNRDQAVLCSIIDKTLLLIETDRIVSYWETTTYDYQSKLLRAQRPWLFGAIGLSLIIIALVFILFVRSRTTGKHLEKLVKERTSELEIKKEEAHSASRSKSAFLANMSHEIRTPLNVVIGLTDLVLEENNLSKSAYDNLHKINNAGNTLLSIVNDILDFSKIESGNLTLLPSEYHVSSLLNDVITLVNTRIGEKPIIFSLNINDDLPNKLFGDDLRIKQIFNNLLSNAIKYTEAGNIELTVNVINANDGRNSVWMEITVRDTGVGIGEENLKKLFMDYFQVESRASKKVEGTGLGLSITKRLVEMMDGKITAESKTGKGSIFRVRIRQGYVNSAQIGPEIAENLRKFRYAEDNCLVSKKLVRSDMSFAKVLVVDDMQTNLDVATGLLGKYKMHVDCVLNGQEAVERLRLGVPVYNVIFMDHMMPEMDGIETAIAIRDLNTEYAKNIPIIALTANAIQGTEEMFYANGFQAFLSKPIDIMQLDSVIKKWISRKE
jgi:signal transduction histidine kinase/CheY-like chemotaxis protein